MPTIGHYASQALEFFFQCGKYIIVDHLSKWPFFSSIAYWLVNHPKIVNFSWEQGELLGSTPRFLAITVVSYLFFTFLVTYMQLPPLKRSILKPFSAIHSFILVVVSLAMALGGLLSLLFNSPNVEYFVCFPKNTRPKGPIFFWAYVFYLSKIYEYVDTFIIVMSKSMRRLTFLHIYHHATVPVMCYFALQTSQSMFPWVLIVNACVHVIMYYYYLQCAIGLRPKWKKLVTDCQIVQFFMSFGIMAWIFYYHYTGEGCSGITAWKFDAVFIASLLGLFIDFHYKNYNKKIKIKANGVKANGIKYA